MKDEERCGDFRLQGGESYGVGLGGGFQPWELQGSESQPPQREGRAKDRLKDRPGPLARRQGDWIFRGLSPPG